MVAGEREQARGLRAKAVGCCLLVLLALPACSRLTGAGSDDAGAIDQRVDANADGSPDTARPDLPTSSEPSFVDASFPPEMAPPLDLPPKLDRGPDSAPAACTTMVNFVLATSPSVAQRPERVHAADLDGDGLDDLLVIHRHSANTPGGDALGVLLQLKAGGFASEQLYSAGKDPSDLVVADFDGDGLRDVVVTAYDQDYVGGTFTLLRGTGGGALATGTPQSSKVDNKGANPFTVVAAKMNSDNHLDLVIAHNNGTGWPINVFLGDGQGGFKPSWSVAGGQNPQRLFAVDLSGSSNDAKHVVVGTVYTGVRTYENKGSALAFDKQPLNGAREALAVGDLDGDGTPDLASANGTPNASGDYKLDILLTQTSGSSFVSGGTVTLPHRARYLRLRDLDGDGARDIALVDGQTLRVFFNKKLTFGTGVTVGLPGADGLAIGHFDGDSRLDIAVTDEDAGTLRVYRQTCAP